MTYSHTQKGISGIALAVFLGNSSIPIAVMTRLLQ